MMRLTSLLAIVSLSLARNIGAADAAPSLRKPRATTTNVVLASAAQTDWRYLAFPALLEQGDEILVSIKRARSHAQDPGAALELVRLDPVTGGLRARATLAQLDGHIMQMGEWVRFPNGEIANYIDAQVPSSPTRRAGLRVVRSTDGGKTFGPLERVGAIDGVEYGYAFDAISEGRTTWMLAMTFANLPGGKPAPNARPPAGSVDVIRTDDNGRTWRFVRNLSREFGDAPLNESAFLRQGDGWLVCTRSYDNHQRLHHLDGEFRLRRQVDLTAAGNVIAGAVGRPRLFSREGQTYLLGRNSTVAGQAMQLCLFRLELATLGVASCAILDNAEGARVTDGYYAMPWFRGSGAETMLHIVTYKGCDGKPPDIVHLVFKWDEVK